MVVAQRRLHDAAPQLEPAAAEITEDLNLAGVLRQDQVLLSIAVEVGPFTVTLETATIPTGKTAADFLEANDKIRLVQWNSTTTANNVTGTIGWEFDSDPADFAYLGSGKQTTIVYAVEVEDKLGATDLETVTITVRQGAVALAQTAMPGGLAGDDFASQPYLPETSSGDGFDSMF